MKFLYVDRFRGFSDTYLNMQKVNFFVGENSTGKTSLMALIYFLLSQRPLQPMDFNDDNVRLGAFNDMTRDNSFTIAYAVENKEGIYYWKYVFTEVDGVAKIIEAVFSDFKRKAMVSIADGKFLSFEDNSGYKKMESFATFQKWVSDYSLNFKKHAKELKWESSPKMPLNLVLYVLLQNVEISNSRKVIEDFLLRETRWIAPVRARPLEYYLGYKTQEDADGTHIPFEFKKMNGGKSKLFKDALTSFGKESGLFDSINVQQLNENQENSPFSLIVKRGENESNFAFVGYGISQIFPILVEVLSPRSIFVENVFFIQQPEVHLHPRAQAAFGKLLHKISQEKETPQFFIETHSDYLIDRFRLCQNKEKVKNDAQVLYFTNTDGVNKIEAIGIDDKGNYCNQPDSFKEFFFNETLSMLELD